MALRWHHYAVPSSLSLHGGLWGSSCAPTKQKLAEVVQDIVGHSTMVHHVLRSQLAGVHVPGHGMLPYLRPDLDPTELESMAARVAGIQLVGHMFTQA